MSIFVTMSNGTGSGTNRMPKGDRPALPVIERLEGKTVREGDCWLWTGAKQNKDGYGCIMTGSRKDGSRRVRGTHIVAFEHYHGPVPEGKEVGHKCHRRNCWNPAHLVAQTHTENMNDLSPEGYRKKQEVMREIQKKRWM